jgi:hypothetical protein
MSSSIANVSVAADVLPADVLPAAMLSAGLLPGDVKICWECLGDDLVTAWALGYPDCRGVGVSQESALAALRARLAEQRGVTEGAIEILSLPESAQAHPPTDRLSEHPASHPLLGLAGVFKDDADFAAIVAQLRAERELGEDDLAYTLTAR